MNTRLVFISVAICAGVLSALPQADAQSSGSSASGRITHWKWKDAQGRIQFSDRPPPAGIPDRDILARPTPFKASEFLTQAQAASAPAAKKATEPEQGKASAAEDPAQAQKRREIEAQNKRIRAENCERARSQLAFMENGGAVTRVNAQGEREVIDDSGRSAEMNRLRQAVQSECR